MDGRERWTAVAALADPSRQALYDYVRRQDHPVGREEAAEALGMSRGLAAFHLDKLVDAGLLHARYEAPAEVPRGRGRTPKVYQAAEGGLAITIPERRYELIAEILADAVADDPGHARGAAQRGTALLDVLARLGFEPDRAGGDPVVLRNCPFHALAMRQTALVCAINHAFLSGVVEGL